MRAFARVVVSAALLGILIPIALSGPTASAAPTAGSPVESVQFDLYNSSDYRNRTYELNGPFFTEDIATAPHPAPIVFQSDAINSNHGDPVPQSPAIALPPAVASGFGLLCVLAVCMMLRRFAYRPAQTSRRH